MEGDCSDANMTSCLSGEMNVYYLSKSGDRFKNCDVLVAVVFVH